MHTLSLMGARLRECGADPQLWNAAEVAEVPGHEFQVVVERCGGNLEIGVGQNAALVLKVEALPRADRPASESWFRRWAAAR